MTERDEARDEIAALRRFRQQTALLRPPPGAKERLIARLSGGEAALESFRERSAAARPALGSKERVLAEIEGRGRQPLALRPRARVALVFVGVLVAGSVGAVTLPNVSLPLRLLPGLTPTPTPTVPPLGAPRGPAATPRPAAAAEGKATRAPEAAPAGEAEAAPALAARPEAVPAPSPSPAQATPGGGAAPGHARSGAGAHVSSDTLAQQVGEYQRALALAGRNDEAALGAWRSFVHRWPASPLRHEVDLQIVAALGRLGRRGELEAAARGFLRDHPKSPRSGDVRNVLRAGEHLAFHSGRGLRMAERRGRRQRWPFLLLGASALAAMHCTDDLDLGSVEQRGGAGRGDVAGHAGEGASGVGHGSESGAGGAGGTEACGGGGDCQAGGAGGQGGADECDNSGPGNCEDRNGSGGSDDNGSGGSSGPD